MQPITAQHRRDGFTLVEMLVVVLIIAVLIGLTVKILGGAGRQAAKAHTVAKIERVKHAIEEFYSEYGQYPPVPVYGREQPVRYEYPWMGGNFGQAQAYFLPGASAEGNEQPLFVIGLLGFLLPRHNVFVTNVFRQCSEQLRDNPQWRQYNDQDLRDEVGRDTDAMARWLPFLQGPPNSILHGPEASDGYVIGGVPYTNVITTVLDGWDRELHYESKPPHQTYKLWSLGPDAGNPADDIYGHTGH
jgi:prepilin-type N-terminal cleavage/methylation domain-containing protein